MRETVFAMTSGTHRLHTHSLVERDLLHQRLLVGIQFAMRAPTPTMTANSINTTPTMSIVSFLKIDDTYDNAYHRNAGTYPCKQHQSCYCPFVHDNPPIFPKPMRTSTNTHMIEPISSIHSSFMLWSFQLLYIRLNLPRLSRISETRGNRNTRVWCVGLLRPRLSPFCWLFCNYTIITLLYTAILTLCNH